MTLENWVVVLDLDDTLISETEYQKSGIAAVEEFIAFQYKRSFQGRIQAALDAGVKDIWGWACEQLGLPLEVKTSFLWLYRLHTPSIKLADGVQALLCQLRSEGAKLAILSDGRSTTQRIKVSAAGLDGIPLFISEEYQSTKPEPDRFLAIEQQWPYHRYVYVADNPAKDFVTPHSLGWMSIGAQWISPRVHSIPESLNSSEMPACWAASPVDVFRLIQHLQT
jgi:putative hydrolase of the HAD superfamily